MEEQFLTFLNQIEGVKKGSTFLLAISGGKDSMVMYDLFLKNGLNFEVAHCNFGLRGQFSDQDEDFIRITCESDGKKFHSIKFETKNYANKMGMSTQMAARELRYNWFEKIRVASKLDFIATAHHLTDSFETIILNIARGTGIRGMTGIADKNNKIIRPLLIFPMEEIITYVGQKNIQWREDGSNAEITYKRNKVRHLIYPEILKINTSFDKTFQRTANRLRNFQEWFNLQEMAFKSNYVREINDCQVINLELVVLDNQEFLLNQYLENLGLSYEKIQEIWQNSGKSGLQYFSDSYKVLQNRKELLIRGLVFESENNEYILEADKDNVSEYGIFEIRKEDPVNCQPDFTNKNFAWFDFENIEFPLKLRIWQNGDLIRPLGMKGKKKISDILINQKVDIFSKSKQLVVLSGDEVIWLVSRVISEKYKVKNDTKKLLRIYFTPS